ERAGGGAADALEGDPLAFEDAVEHAPGERALRPAALQRQVQGEPRRAPGSLPDRRQRVRDGHLAPRLWSRFGFMLQCTKMGIGVGCPQALRWGYSAARPKGLTTRAQTALYLASNRLRIRWPDEPRQLLHRPRHPRRRPMSSISARRSASATSPMPCPRSCRARCPTSATDSSPCTAGCFMPCASSVSAPLPACASRRPSSATSWAS